MGRGRGIFFHDEIAMQMEKGIVKEKEYNEEEKDIQKWLRRKRII